MFFNSFFFPQEEGCGTNKPNHCFKGCKHASFCAICSIQKILTSFVDKCEGLQRPGEANRPLEMELQAVVSQLMCVLLTQLGSSERTVCKLSC